MLTNEELLLVKGGAITATLFNSLSRFMESIYKFGYNLGSSIRRIAFGTPCKTN